MASPAKRTPLDVRLEARRRFFAHEGPESIAAAVGVAPQTIHSWANDEGWREQREALEKETTDAFVEAHRQELLHGMREVVSLGRKFLADAAERFERGQIKVESVAEAERAARMIRSALGDSVGNILETVQSPEERDAKDPLIEQAVARVLRSLLEPGAETGERPEA